MTACKHKNSADDVNKAVVAQYVLQGHRSLNFLLTKRICRYYIHRRLKKMKRIGIRNGTFLR